MDENKLKNLKIEEVAQNEELKNISNFTLSRNVPEEKRLQNTDTITYIYDAQDFAEFRDNVNAGNNYAGKTIYLMDNIDLTSVCSETVGTWTPIGHTTEFSGTFDGNYYTVSNLYINSGAYQYEGLFSKIGASGIIRNTILSNVYVRNVFNNATIPGSAGAFAGIITGGKIINCGVDSGSIYCIKTIGNSGTAWKCQRVGGITGDLIGGEINSCYNKAYVEGRNVVQNYNSVYIGGIVGCNSGGPGKVYNCYNTGTVYAQAYFLAISGIVGDSLGLTSGRRNCKLL
jgi:hypothetical protein